MDAQPTRWGKLRAFAWAITKPVRWLASFFNPQDPTTSMKRGNMAISTVMLGNQYLLPARSTAPARPVVPAVVPSPAAGPAVEISRPVIPVAARPKLVSYSTRSGQRPEAAPRDEQDRPNVADTAAKP